MKIRLLYATPQIVITLNAWSKMCAYTSIATDEVGWIGTVDYDEDSYTYTITDVFLIEQEANASTCSIKPDGILDFFEKRIENGESTDNVLFWGHSHVNMGVFASAQDETEFKNLYEDTPFYIRLIMNKKQEVSISMYFADTLMIIDDMPFTIDYGMDTTGIAEELKAKVTKKPYYKYNYKKYGYGYGNDYYDDDNVYYYQTPKGKTPEEVYNYLVENGVSPKDATEQAYLPAPDDRLSAEEWEQLLKDDPIYIYE